MSISIFAVLAVAFSVLALLALGAGPSLQRRLRRARLVRAVVVGIAAVLVPMNGYLTFIPHDQPDGHPWATADVVTSIAALCAVATLVMSLRIQQCPAGLPRRVLAIGAHPDDLELACGGTLAKLLDSGHEVRALVMTHGGQGASGTTRPSEARSGGRFLGTTQLQVLDFPDTRLASYEREIVASIETVINRFNPDIIFTHSSHDQHQDHHAVHLATLRAGRRHQAILCYESPSATSSFSPSVFVDIEDYVDVKVAAVGVHRDQRRKSYMSPERIRALAVHRGSQAKTRHAEGYEPVRMLGTTLGVS